MYGPLLRPNENVPFELSCVLLRDCADPRRFWPLVVAGNLTVLYGPALLRVFGR